MCFTLSPLIVLFRHDETETQATRTPNSNPRASKIRYEVPGEDHEAVEPKMLCWHVISHAKTKTLAVIMQGHDDGRELRNGAEKEVVPLAEVVCQEWCKEKSHVRC